MIQVIQHFLRELLETPFRGSHRWMGCLEWTTAACVFRKELRDECSELWAATPRSCLCLNYCLRLMIPVGINALIRELDKRRRYVQWCENLVASEQTTRRVEQLRPKWTCLAVMDSTTFGENQVTWALLHIKKSKLSRPTMSHVWKCPFSQP